MSEPTPGRHRRRRWFRRWRHEVDQFHRDLIRGEQIDEEFHEINELRISALEEIVAARWPRSVVVRCRLARDLRASVAHIQQGETFAEKRSETVTSGWIIPRGKR